MMPLPGPPSGPPPAMAGMGMPGMGPSPMGGPPPGAVAALDQLSQQPPGDGHKDALMDAQSKIQVALGSIMLRSPKAAKALSDALGKINQALMTLEQEASNPVGPPPELLGALMGQPMGSPLGGPSPMG